METQNDFLIYFWNEVKIAKWSRLELLRAASQIRWIDKPMPRKQLKSLRNNFNTAHVIKKKYPLSTECFICGLAKEEGNHGEYFMVRHHIIPLSKWGSNRLMNIVTVCTKCHAAIHPWISEKPLEQMLAY